MARYRKVATHIWQDQKFRKLSVQQKLDTLKAIVFDQANDYFRQFCGPAFYEGERVNRRPDLCSATWRRIRREILAYSDLRCSDDPTIDHVRPVSRGAEPFDKTNLVISCRACNSRKGCKEGWG